MTAIPGLPGTWAGAAWAGTARVLVPEQRRRYRDMWCRKSRGCDAEVVRTILMWFSRGVGDLGDAERRGKEDTGCAAGVDDAGGVAGVDNVEGMPGGMDGHGHVFYVDPEP